MLAALLVGCSADHYYAAGTLITTSYVPEYRHLSDINVTWTGSVLRLSPVYGPGYVCNAFSRGDKRALFDSLAQKNHDTGYNGPVTWECQDTRHSDTTFVCFAPDINIVSVDVVCAEAYDAEHPAGSSLSDIIYLRGNILAGWVSGGYHQGYDPRTMSDELRLDEMTAADYRLKLASVGQYPELSLARKPDSAGPHALQIDIRLDDSAVISRTVTITLE